MKWKGSIFFRSTPKSLLSKLSCFECSACISACTHANSGSIYKHRNNSSKNEDSGLQSGKEKKKKNKGEKQSSAIAWIHGYVKTEHKK